MRTFAIVSCVAEKASRPTHAEFLYRSQWFRKAANYVRPRYSSWAVLSAKHGLIHPATTIEPYEMTLNNMPIAKRRAWANRVIYQLAQTHWDELDIFAGARYREFIEPWLIDNNFNYSVPLKGMGIGQQLKWFKENA